MKSLILVSTNDNLICETFLQSSFLHSFPSWKKKTLGAPIYSEPRSDGMYCSHTKVLTSNRLYLHQRWQRFGAEQIILCLMKASCITLWSFIWMKSVGCKNLGVQGNTSLLDSTRVAIPLNAAALIIFPWPILRLAVWGEYHYLSPIYSCAISINKATQ